MNDENIQNTPRGTNSFNTMNWTLEIELLNR